MIESRSVSDVCRVLGLSVRSGRTNSEVRDAIKKEGICTEHFTRCKHTKEKLAEAVKNNVSMAGVLRDLGYFFQAGGTHTHISNRIKELGIDTSHFLGQRSNLGRKFISKLNAGQILVKRESGRRQHRHLLKRALLESGAPHECNKCGLESKWEGKNLTLPIDHINGNPLDDRGENLRFLCPNCHSQTPTFSRRRRIEPG